MKICFFSDIHGNLLALKGFMEQTVKQDIDKYIFGGDVFGYYYHADEIIDIFRKREITCLLGNHDKMFLDLADGKVQEAELIAKYGNSYSGIIGQVKEENISYLRTLPLFYELKQDNIRMAFFHGGPQEYLNMRIYPDTEILDKNYFDKYDYVFVGHTHHKMERRIGNCMVINPGSLGQQRDGKGCSYLVFDTKTKEIQRFTVEYSKEELVKEINCKETNAIMRERLIEVVFRK